MAEETTAEGIRQAKRKLKVAVLKSTAAASFIRLAGNNLRLCLRQQAPKHHDHRPDFCAVEADVPRRVMCEGEKLIPLARCRLAVIGNCNMEMNGGDIADQLVKNYDPRGSLRERFWWRVVEGMIEDRCYVNAFLLCTRQCQLENVTPMTHYRFLSETYQAMIKDALPPKPARPLPSVSRTPSPASTHTPAPLTLKRTRAQQAESATRNKPSPSLGNPATSKKLPSPPPSKTSRFALIAI
jgi:hypothetical protein